MKGRETSQGKHPAFSICLVAVPENCTKFVAGEVQAGCMELQVEPGRMQRGETAVQLEMFNVSINL